VQVRSGQSRSGQASSECCHLPGDWQVRSVHSKEAGREDSAPTSFIVAMPTPSSERKAASGQALGELVSESPEFLARGMLSSGFPANTGELTTSREVGSVRPTQRHQVPGARGPLHGKRTTLNAEKPAVKGDRRRQLRVDEQSYEPMVPMKVEKRRAPARGGHAIHWRDGANKWTYRRGNTCSRHRTRSRMSNGA
jgi:hypothetical protein